MQGSGSGYSNPGETLYGTVKMDCCIRDGQEAKTTGDVWEEDMIGVW